jgi:RHS repeat-associated protein
MVNQITHSNGVVDTQANDRDSMRQPSLPTSAVTNRLNGTGTSYDTAGNLIAWNGNTYQYDGFNQMIRMKSGAEDWAYIYTAGDERFWSYRVGGGGSLWALRDLDGKLLREYEAHTSWSTFKDYIYRGSQLLASSHPTEGVRHLHLDHLGTPRLVTAGSTGGDFFTLTPCRVLDTRDQSAPLTPGETRTVALAGVCGIPSSATAVSVNITAIDATAQGEMTAWPANEPQPATSAISYQTGLNRANNGILKLGNGALAFYANQLSGTVHLVIDVNGYFTEPAGAVVAYHVYYPFGEEATAFNQDTEQMKFTGHERDLASLAGAGDDLDYMHARFRSPFTGRFLSIDSHPGKLSAPQSWNRYAYVRNAPLVLLDPNGLEEVTFTLTTSIPFAMVSAPFFSGTRYFHGDEGANTFRTRQAFVIQTDPAKAQGNPVLRQKNEAGRTIELDKNGATKATAVTAKVGNVSGQYIDGKAVVNVITDSSNPLVAGAPAINNDLTITANKSGSFIITGSLDGFPSVTLAATNESGHTFTVFQFNPQDVDNGLSSLCPGVGDQAVQVQCIHDGRCSGSVDPK